MKRFKYFLMAAVCTTILTACMNDNDKWDENERPSRWIPAYGNNNILEHNVVTIAEFIDRYKDVINSDGMTEIKEELQIKGRVTGNDVEGNMYKKATFQDETAAMTVTIDESGIWGYLPIGQEILVDLKGLWVGGYGNMPQLGVPYRSATSGALSVSRMPRALWEQHFKITGSIDESKIQPTVFTKEVQNNPSANAAKLVIFKNVTFRDADGVKTLKDSETEQPSGYFHQKLNEFDDNVVIFTSGSYARFSTWVMPYDTEAKKAIPCDIIGIASYYRGTWQISIRQGSDLRVRR